MSLEELLDYISKHGIRLWTEGHRLRYQGPPSFLTPEVLAQLSLYKSQLLEFLERSQVDPGLDSVSITHRAKRNSYPLSFAQQRLWFLEQLEPGASVYSMPIAWRLEGQLRVEVLLWALDQLRQRHDVLRTRLEPVEGGGQAKVEEGLEVDWHEEDLRGEGSPLWEERLREECLRPMDLNQGPLWRAGMMRIGEDEHILWLVLHHMIGDAWSLGIIERELRLLYESRLQGGGNEVLPAQPLQYADYAVWQREWLAGDRLGRQLQYWKERLRGIQPLDLPVDGIRGIHNAGRRYRRVVGADTLQQIRRMNREAEVTLFMSFLAGLGLLLSRYSGQKKVVIGTPIANRTREEWESVVGFFANTLAMVVEVRREERVKEYLDRVREDALQAYDHQDMPFEKLVEEVSPERDLGRHPLFQVMLSMQNAPREARPLGNVKMREVEVDRGTSKFDWEVVLEETAEGELLLVVEYAASLFSEATIHRMIGHWLELMQDMSANLESHVSDLSIMQAQNLVVASTFTAEPIEETLQFWMKYVELPWRITFAPYNQVFQQLLDPTSPMMSNNQGANAILVQFKDWSRASDAGEQPETREQKMESATHDLIRALKSAVPQMKVPCLLCLCSPAGHAASEEKFHERMENLLVSELGGLGGLVLIQSSEIDKLYPVSEKHDPHGDALGHVPYTPDYFAALGTILARRLYVLKNPPYKVIVCDCDQTLWGGRCGEDGPNGIVVNAHRNCLQKFLSSKIQEGFLVCLCSKNNEEEVLQTFQANPGMPLRLESLASWRINWAPKSENLRALAAELNLGLDSFIFLDDDGLECEEVRRHCPEVLVLQVPAEESEIPRFINHIWAFDRLRVTTEDQQRTQLYQQDRQRAQLEKDSLNFQEFLESLKVTVDCQPLASEDLARAAQLTQRTNQFNASTRRRNETELQQLLQTAGFKGWGVRVQDRFGDYGLVGLMLAAPREGRFWVDTFLLSCRALGRGVEHQMLAFLGGSALDQKLDYVEIPCQPTARNRPAIDFLENTGALYRRDSGPTWSILYPSSVAAQTVFRPPQSRPSDLPRERHAASPSPSSSLSRSNLQRIPQIAHELFDVGRVRERIHSLRPQVQRNLEGFIEPRDDVEKVVASLWAEVLGVNRVGVQDNFFHLGGHSLMATKMLSQVARVFQVQPSLRIIFESPTLGAFAHALVRLESQPGQMEKIASIFLAINSMTEEEQDAYLNQMQ